MSPSPFRSEGEDRRRRRSKSPSPSSSSFSRERRRRRIRRERRSDDDDFSDSGDEERRTRRRRRRRDRSSSLSEEEFDEEERRRKGRRGDSFTRRARRRRSYSSRSRSREDDDGDDTRDGRYESSRRDRSRREFDEYERRPMREEEGGRRCDDDDRYYDHRHRRDDDREFARRDGGEDLDVDVPPPFARGEIRKGIVRSIQPYGLFVRLMEEAEEENKEDVYGGGGGRGGRGRRHLPDGLVHASQVSNDITFQRDDTDEAKVQSLSYFFPVDAKVFAKVLKCEKDPARGWKVSLSMKNVDQESGEDKDPENRENGFNANNNTNNNHDGYRNNNNNASTASFTADLFGVYEGKVSSIKPYGVFVNLENTRTSALIHVSEISEHLRFSREDTDEDKVMGIEGVLSVGESCFVKIIEMKPPESERDRMKLSGSIRLVDQKSGEDLDPENRKLRERRDGGGGGDGGRFNKKPVGADAGEKVQPGGIVHWGHEKADVKEQSKNAYDFVVDVEDDQKHEPKADDYSKPRFGHGLEGYVPEIKKGKKRKDSSSSKKDKKKDSKKRKKREKKEKKKRKKSRKRDKRKKKSSSSSHSSSSSDSDSYSSSSY